MLVVSASFKEPMVRNDRIQLIGNLLVLTDGRMERVQGNSDIG